MSPPIDTAALRLSLVGDERGEVGHCRQRRNEYGGRDKVREVDDGAAASPGYQDCAANQRARQCAQGRGAAQPGGDAFQPRPSPAARRRR